MKDKNLNVKTYCKDYLKVSVDLWIFLLLSLSQIIIAEKGGQEGGLIFLTTNNISRVNEVAQRMKMLIE